MGSNNINFLSFWKKMSTYCHLNTTVNTQVTMKGYVLSINMAQITLCDGCAWHTKAFPVLEGPDLGFCMCAQSYCDGYV